MMNRLRTICAIALLALATCAPAFAEDGIMGTGKPLSTGGIMGTGGTQVSQTTPTDDTVALNDGIDGLLLAAKLAIWQSILAHF